MAGEEGPELEEELPALVQQDHHVISRPIRDALEKVGGEMETQFKRNDKNYIVGAVNKAAHWGYQTWHREIDKEVVDWILAHPDAPANELRTLLREIYSRPGVSWRFPGYKVP